MLHQDSKTEEIGAVVLNGVQAIKSLDQILDGVGLEVFALVVVVLQGVQSCRN